MTRTTTPAAPSGGLHYKARLACAMALFATAPATGFATPSGEIRFVIGEVRITSATGSTRLAAAGSNILTGDRIETGSAGHIHLRMSDGGFVSVRPGSRFVIEQYETAPDNTAIRFRLEEGVVRSITGTAAQTQKDRFRLNTPLAAIGVRGTDFVVQSKPDGLKAVVNQGAIVVSPFDSNCLAQALGPCNGNSARELSDAMGRVLLELKRLSAPTIVPINGKSPDGLTPPAPQELGSRPTLAVAAETAIASPSGIAGEGSNNVRPTPPTTPTVPVQPLPAERPIPTTQPAEISQLQWGRWSDARDGDTLSSTTSEARQGRGIAVGNSYVNLYRTPDDTRPLPAQLGQVSFGLAAGQVSLVQTNGSSSAGTVNGGWLQMDFAQRQFATELKVSHPQTGTVLVQAAGAVTNNGTFYVNKPGSLVTGAVTMDGSQAGYAFDKAVPQGSLSGATLWKR